MRKPTSDYHEKLHPYAPVTHIPPGHGVTAILDGQQQLTALNIGLYGSHAERQPRKWWNNPDAFPKKRLYLNFVGGPDAEPSELDMVYHFRFLTNEKAKPAGGQADGWYREGEVLTLEDSGPAISRRTRRAELCWPSRGI